MKNVPVVLVGLAMVSAAFANPAHDKLMSMSEESRNAAFARLLSSSGERCPAVSRSMYQGSSKDGAVFWSLQCKPGESFQLMLENNARGSSKLLNCKVVKALNAGECFRKF